MIAKTVIDDIKNISGPGMADSSSSSSSPLPPAPLGREDENFPKTEAYTPSREPSCSELVHATANVSLERAQIKGNH